MHSSYFEALFFGEFAEHSKDEVTISKVDPDHFAQFLQIIYPASKEVNGGLLIRTRSKQLVPLANNVMGLVELADQFDAKSVLAKCQQFLCSEEGDKKFSIYEKLKVADQRNLAQVKVRLLSWAPAVSLLDRQYSTI